MKIMLFKFCGLKKALERMRKYIPIAVFSFTLLTNSAFASGQVKADTVTIVMKNATVKDVLKEIESKSNYFFLYDKKNVNENRVTNVSVENRDVTEVLNQLFSNTDVSYMIEGRHIILSKKSTENMQNPTQVTQRRITGTVTDEHGEPIIGATIAIAGQANGTITDMDGNFILSNVPENGTINVSFIGYVTENVNIKGKNSFAVVLKEDSKTLDEVIVIGYGTTTRKSVVGAVDQISSKIIQDRPVSNVSQALQGSSPGLVIQQKSMNPNDNSMNVNIRGVSTLNDNTPLVVIDGMVSDFGSMNSLNPNDIESISVLKDAGTAAIYGSRSSNGVILVTTKKGRLDMKPVVRFGAMIGSQNPHLLATPLKGYQNALLRNEALVNSGQSPYYTSQEIREFAQGDSEYMLNQILRNALQQNYNVSVQGGSKTTAYMISAAYFNQESNFIGSGYGLERYNFRSNLTTEYKRLKLTTIMAYDRNEGKSYPGHTGFMLADAARLPVYNIYKAKDENGRYYANDVLTGGNPVAALERGGYTNSDNDHLQASINAELDIFKGLKAKAMLGYDLRADHDVKREFYIPVYMSAEDTTPINESSSKNNHINDYTRKTTFLNTQFLLDYSRVFNNVHSVNALAGFSNESSRFRGHRISKKYVDPDLGIPNDDTEIDEESHNTPNNTGENSIYSWFGRVEYSYMDKYYIGGSFRYDASSKFAKGKRWGFFPSVSLGWRLSEENFMDFWKENVGDAKLRATYGVLGNQNVDNYEIFTTYTIYNNQYGFNNSSVTGTGYTFGNPDLTWESTATFNMGVDASFLDNRLNITYDYFYKKTTGILMKPEVPGTLGGAVSNANLGEMKNQGWELNISYRINHGDFMHRIGANIGDSWNEVTKFVGEEQISKSDEIERIVRVGLPLYCYYGYKTDGYFKNEEEIMEAALPIGASVQPGDIRFVDRNGDGIIDDNDRFVLGHAFPRYTFGFTYDFSWKGLDFSMLWQGVGKRDMAVRGELIEPYHGGYSFVMYKHQLDYWTPNNQDARYPRLAAAGSSSNVNNYGVGSDLHIINAAYLRLKNIQVGYTLPKNWSKKIGAERVRFYVNGQNLFTFSKASFIDPESSEFDSRMGTNSANSGRNYPVLKYYGGGIDIEF